MAGNLVDDGDFMAEAVRISAQSENPKWKVGAVIVRKTDTGKEIVGEGFNNAFNLRNDEGRHAEINAITHAISNIANLSDCAIYVTMFPCPNCARNIKKSNIRIVKYMERNDALYRVQEAWDIFREADIEPDELKMAGIDHTSYAVDSLRRQCNPNM